MAEDNYKDMDHMKMGLKSGKDMGSWSELSNDLSRLIMDRLITDPFSATENILRFRLVCQSWRSVPVDKRYLSLEYPWLMLAEKEDDSDTRGFYSLSTRKVYHLNLPEAGGRRCWSSCGWLITFGLDMEIHLLNPFSRVQIRLPPQSKLPFQYSYRRTLKRLRTSFIDKIMLSSGPSLSVKTTTSCEDADDEDDDDEKCVALAICGEFSKLAFLRLGDEVWTPVDSHTNIQDIIFFNGQFYAINIVWKLLICDIFSPHPKTLEFAEPPEAVKAFRCSKNNYLVESLGELFMVVRDFLSIAGPRQITNFFYVYKFNFNERKWTEVKSLDNRALFVGANTSFAIFPSDHPGCKPNCIYFTDNDQINLIGEVGGHDMGLFCMESQKIDVHYEGPDIHSLFCTPLWISPSL